uniref:Uncharacterized protein n=1 Tax=Crocodylus porosus TaxID=8502 RepID=A0A7M4FZL7_CROPO
MKIAGVFVLLALAFFCFFSGQSLFGQFSCTKENDPVRDSFGKEHSNKCLLCLDPMWDSSGKEHNNKCVLCAERL